MQVDLARKRVGADCVDLVVAQVEDLEDAEVLEEAGLNLGDVVGGEVEERELVQAGEDPGFDPVLVQAVASQVQDLG